MVAQKRRGSNTKCEKSLTQFQSKLTQQFWYDRSRIIKTLKIADREAV